MRKAILLSLFTFSLLPTFSQTKKIGDFTETFTNNVSGTPPRTFQYTPDNGDFLCYNGKNRFTRALYGNHTEYRIETSDFPVFALYKAKNYKSLRFYINGIRLDSVQFCEARYGKGRRTYRISDDRWGKAATLSIECVAMHDKEGCYWQFKTSGFNGKVTLAYKLCDIAIPKLKRNGDLGADKAGCFEPDPHDKNLVEGSITFNGTAYAISEPSEDKAIGHTVSLVSCDTSHDKAFITSRSYFENLASRIVFSTPDPYLNTLGSTLTLAADGDWDGETWLHGAIGWRIQLAGWRAGFLGDVLGWQDRAVTHFNAYAKSQLTDCPPNIPSPSQDPKQLLSRGKEQLGTEMFSNGYICRYPGKTGKVNHYDMNLNYIDELLWHFEYDADTAYMRKMWPVLKLHLQWEKRNFDPDNNHLYDAYCCIWASDALYYNGGEVTHSSAYNYRANLLAAKIARKIGEDPTPYQEEADAILKAMNDSLWTGAVGDGTAATNSHWAEYRDVMGLKRLHTDAAVWSIYTPVDCSVGTPQQMYQATGYINSNIPHIPVEIATATRSASPDLANLRLISTSDWMPYSWSINNVASAEIMHTALAFFEAGRAREGYDLVKSNIMDQMYLGASPGNLGQISYYDASRGESYRDFGDNIGISSRAIIQGLFGIVPNALDGKCYIRPGFPLSWDSLTVKTPYLSYRYKRTGNTGTLTIRQHFTTGTSRNGAAPHIQPLLLIARINGKDGAYTDYAGTTDSVQTITFPVSCDMSHDSNDYVATEKQALPLTFNMSPFELMPAMKIDEKSINTAYRIPIQYNANVTDIFRNEYLSPRPKTTSLEIPIHGIGEWCHPQYMVDINDSVFRSLIVDDTFLANGIEFSSPKTGNNIAFTSLWDNYPDSITIPVTKGKSGKYGRSAQMATFLITGSTNHMQTKLPNATITAVYSDGTESVMTLTPPYNYCPIEQDYYIDGKAFKTLEPKPWRISFGTGKMSRELGKACGIPSDEVYGRELPGGAAQIATMLLDPKKKVKEFRLRCLSNDIVVGIMAITLY